MKTWRLRYTSAARRQLKGIRIEDPAGARELARRIDALQYNPFPSGSKLRKPRSGYRLKIPPYRVLYVVYDSGLIKVLKIGRRDDNFYNRRNPV